MDIVFFGTPSSCLPIVKTIYSTFNLSLIISKSSTLTLSRRKRNESKLQAFSNSKSISYLTPKKLDSSFIQNLYSIQPDIFVICAYGKILNKKVLSIPKFGTINIHPSLLPKYRGPSPVQYSLKNLDVHTGFTFIKMDEGIDTGDILFKSLPIKIEDEDTTESLTDKIFFSASKKINKSIQNLFDNSHSLSKQNNKLATYTKLISKKDGEINWHETSKQLNAKIRAYSNWPGLYTFHNTKKIKILNLKQTTLDSTIPGKIYVKNNQIYVDTSTKKILISSIQLEGKKINSAYSYFKNFDISNIVLG
jgi:methionyl-tRNA formyltransferase